MLKPQNYFILHLKIKICIFRYDFVNFKIKDSKIEFKKSLFSSLWNNEIKSN